MAPKPSPQPTGSVLDRLSVAGKFGVCLVILAAIGGLYFLVFYDEVATEIASAKGLETDLLDRRAQAEASREAYQKDLDEKTRREQLAREQKKILPDDSETPAFLSALQGVATISGVNLTSWTPVEEAPQEFFAKVPMKLTLSGQFHQMAKFFHGVGQLDRIINVEDIQIKSPKAAGDSVEISVECLATAFRAVRPNEGQGSRRKGAGK
jgi:type IV pilus assembly protein PilO